MTVDNRIVSKEGLVDVTPDQLTKSYHDLNTTRESIKQLLANGTPDWARFPQDYKAMVKEDFQEQKEISDAIAAQYKLEDQDLFENYQARMVNPISTKDFLNKLRANGVKCYIVQNPINRQQGGLWAIPKGRTDKVRYVCYLQLPAMYEWSMVNVNKHGVADGEAYRGWRTVLMEGIKKEIWTEEQAHEWFGAPSNSTASSVYRRSLYELRNNKRFVPEFTEK